MAAMLFTICFLAGLISVADRFEFGVSLDGTAAAVYDINFKARKRRTKASLFPGFDSDVVIGSSMIVVLRQTFSIAANVGAGEMEYADTKAFDALYLSFDIGDG